MKIKLLYFAGCPGWKKTDSNIKELLASTKHEYSKLDVNTEKTLHESFYGSPTIVYEDKGKWRDVFGLKGDSIMACRPYHHGGKMTPNIPKEMLKQKLKKLKII